MIYTRLTKKALRLSFEIHKNQYDEGGAPYVYHPFFVAQQMDDEISACVALLHDAVEDSDIMLEDLAEEGFPKSVIEALSIITHESTVPYLEYIRRIKTNPIATKVKLADLRHNSNLDRLEVVDEKAFRRAEKYAFAISLLSERDKNAMNLVSDTEPLY